MKAVSGICCRRRHCRPRRCCPCCRRRPRRHRYFRSSCPYRHCLSHSRFRCTCRCRRRHRRGHRRPRYRCRCKDRSLGDGVTPINIWQIIHIKKNHIHMISLHVSERSALRLSLYVCDFSLCMSYVIYWWLRLQGSILVSMWSSSSSSTTSSLSSSSLSISPSSF